MLLLKLEISIRQKHIFCLPRNLPIGRVPSEFKPMRFWKGRNCYTTKTSFVSYVLWLRRSQHRFFLSNVLRAKNSNRAILTTTRLVSKDRERREVNCLPWTHVVSAGGRNSTLGYWRYIIVASLLFSYVLCRSLQREWQKPFNDY